MNEIEFKLDAMYPETLLEKKMPEGVWVRMEDTHAMGCLVSVRGPVAGVREYIEEHWGGDTLEMLESEGTLTKLSQG